MIELDITYFALRNTLLGAIAVAEGAMEMDLAGRLETILESVVDG